MRMPTRQTKYFYQDLDATGRRLDGAYRYTITFAKDQTPPVRGFWSLTLYNEHHFFAPNEIKRYSVGTKNKSLQYGTDGSLTIYVEDAPQQRRSAATGCPHQTAPIFPPSCGPIGRRSLSPTAHGRHLR